MLGLLGKIGGAGCWLSGVREVGMAGLGAC